MKRLQAAMAVTTHDMFNAGDAVGIHQHISACKTVIHHLYVFVLQKILLGLNGINLKGAGVMGQIFHEKPQLSSSLKAFLVNK